MAVLLGSIVGRPIEAPEWVRARIESNLQRVMPGFATSFGGLTLLVEDIWHPQVLLRDIELKDPGSVTSVTLSDIGGTLALLPMLKGQLRPRDLHLSGAVMNLRREPDGSVNISVGDGAQTVGQSADLNHFISRIDELLLEPQFKALRGVEVEALTLHYDDARAGRGWTVDGGRLRITRQGDLLQASADLALLSGRDYAASVEMNYESKIGSLEAEFGFSFADMAASDIATQTPALAWLHGVRAPISGALRMSIDASGDLGPLNATLQIGAGVLQPSNSVRPIPFQSVRSYFTFLPDSQTLRFDEMSLVSQWVTVRAEGKAHLRGMENGWPTELLGQVQLSSIVTNPDNLYPAPVRLESAMADFRLRLDPFTVDLGQMVIEDQGQNLVLDGTLEATDDDWNLRLDGRMPGVARDRILQLWPERLAPKPRVWVAKNVLGGDLSDVVLAVRSKAGSKPKVTLGFAFDDAEVRFLKYLPPMTGASGHASWMDQRFVIMAETGQVLAPQGGVIDASGTSFVIPNTSVKEGPAQVQLNASGPIPAVLSLLDQKPFQFMTKAGRPVTIAQGRAKARGTIDVRLKKGLPPEDVGLDLQATLSDVSSDQIIPDKKMTAGSLAVTVQDKLLRISGDGLVGAVPFNGVWELPLGKGGGGKSVVQATVELSQRFVKEFKIGLPDYSYSGVGEAQLRVDLAKGKPAEFKLTSDLRGVGLALPPLGWSKPAKKTGVLLATGRLTQPPVVDELVIEGAELKARGQVTLQADGGLNAVSLTSVTLADWLDVEVDILGRGQGRPVAITVNAGQVDSRGLSRAVRQASGTGAAASGLISVALDRLQISDGIALTNFKGEFDPNGGLSGIFSAQINGDTEIAGKIIPHDNGSAFEITSADGGGVLRSAGILEKARHGEFKMRLNPTATAGTYDGHLKILNTRLRGAPAIAELLNAVSVIGLLEQMSDTGIHFAEVEARFQLTPKNVVISQSSAVGPSMGVSMDGLYNFTTGEMDFQGVVSPVYVLNVLGRLVAPRKGEGLFGFNYRLSGKSSDPKVEVNPLSVLTPGFFRDIFRRPSPKPNE